MRVVALNINSHKPIESFSFLTFYYCMVVLLLFLCNLFIIFVYFLISFFLYILPDPLSSIIDRCTLYTPGLISFILLFYLFIYLGGGIL